MPEGKTVLITGATSGLGAALAARFRRDGWRVIGAARREPADPDALDCFLPADLSDPDGAAALAAELQRRNFTVDLLINNAGVGAYATWDELDSAALRRLMEVDFFAPVALTKALLPALRARGGGVINIASVAGLAWVPCMGAYSAAKFALAAFSRTLAVEESVHGLRVMTVYPGRISTGFSSRSHSCRPVPETPGNAAASAAEFAERVWRAWMRGRRSLLYPWWYCFFLWFVKLCPGLYARENIRRWKLR